MRDIVTVSFHGGHYEVYDHFNNEIIIKGKEGNDIVEDTIALVENVLVGYARFRERFCEHLEDKK